MVSGKLPLHPELLQVVIQFSPLYFSPFMMMISQKSQVRPNEQQRGFRLNLHISFRPWDMVNLFKPLRNAHLALPLQERLVRNALPLDIEVWVWILLCLHVDLRYEVEAWLAL